MKYRTIVADPPWPIGDFPEWADGTGVVACPYPVMELPDISALTVGNLADSEAHLYLWTPSSFLVDAHGVARAWGFDPSAVLVWCKEKRGLGLGGLWPNNVEFVLFCRRLLRSYDDERVLTVTRWLNACLKERGVRHSQLLRHFGFNSGSGQIGHWTALTPGSQPAIPTWAQWQELRRAFAIPPQMDDEVGALNAAKGANGSTVPAELRALTGGRWFRWPRGEHSTKPEAFLDLVEQVSPGPYLELFARRQRLGWDTWGDEALNHVNLETS